MVARSEFGDDSAKIFMQIDLGRNERGEKLCLLAITAFTVDGNRGFIARGFDGEDRHARKEKERRACLGAVLLVGYREEVLEGRDTSFIQGVGAKKFGPLASLGVIVSSEALPHGNGLIRIVTCSGHEESANAIGFELLRAGEGEAKGNVARSSEGSGCQLCAFATKSGSEECRTDTDRALTLDASIGMVRGDVSDLVSKDSSEPSVILCDLEDAGIDANLSSGKSKGIGRGVFEDDKLPLCSREVDHASEPRGNTIDLSAVRGI